MDKKPLFVGAVSKSILSAINIIFRKHESHFFGNSDYSVKRKLAKFVKK